MNIINNEMGDLETGEEITLVLINQWGMPVFRHYVYVKHEMTNMPVGRPGKQCIYLWYKEGKRKRKIKGCCFTENSVAIAKGFQMWLVHSVMAVVNLYHLRKGCLINSSLS